MNFFFFNLKRQSQLKYDFFSPCRILYAGVIPPRVKMVVRVGSRALHTLASARLGGLVSTATSPVCPVRWQPNGKVR